MQLRSESFANGGRISKIHAMPSIGGDNRSPHLLWSDPPPGTQIFALTIIDPHPVADNWVHWLVTGIPADVRGLPAGASGRAMPEGCREHRNSFGAPGYGGPQPPAGSGEHPYLCTVYALSAAKLDLPESANWVQVQKALAGKVLAQATVTGKYSQ